MEKKLARKTKKKNRKFFFEENPWKNFCRSLAKLLARNSWKLVPENPLPVFETPEGTLGELC